MRTGLFVLVIGLFSLATPCCFYASEPITPAPAASSDKVGPIKLQDVPLNQILELLERWTGKSLLRPQTLPTANVTLNLKEEVTKAQAIRAIETLLSLNGVGVSALDDNFLKITPLAATKTEAPELITGSTLDLPPSGRTVSKLFRPKFLRVNEFMPQIAGLLNTTTGGTPAIFEKTNTALITDSLTNVQRIEALLTQIDRPETSHLQPKFYSLQFAKAGEVVNKLHGMFTGPLANDLGSASYSSDERTNQIILFADPQQHAVFTELIAKLDVKSGQDTRTDIIYLKHAAAKDVASILTQLVSGQNAPSRGAGAESFRMTSTIAPPTEGSAASPNAPPVDATIVATSLKLPPAAQFSNLLSILPEERSNAVVVSGTDNDIRLLNELIAKIDVLLAQVRIEVVIAEVTLDDNDTTGISALGLQVSGDKLIGFSGSVPGLDVAGATVTRTNPSSQSPVNVSGPWDLAGQISLHTTPRKSTTNILSVPTIITTHNRIGKILVGQSQPIITATQAMPLSGGSNSSFSTSSQVTYKDIGIQLTVKPLIGADGSVQMEISQEVDDILGETTIDGNAQPTIGRRATDSFVSARSGEIIVLGGLRRTSQSRSTSRLGPIPFIGDLLGSRSREKTRTDLVFFLRPTVLSNGGQDAGLASSEIEQYPKAQRADLKKVLQTPASTRKN
jgi:general secretion pathway protein D